MKAWELREKLDRLDPHTLIVLGDEDYTGIIGAEYRTVRHAGSAFPALVLDVPDRVRVVPADEDTSLTGLRGRLEEIEADVSAFRSELQLREPVGGVRWKQRSA